MTCQGLTRTVMGPWMNQKRNPKMTECKEGVFDAATETLVLGIELGESVIKSSPKYLVRVLESPQVQAAIKKALEAEAKKLVEKQARGKTIGNDDGAKAMTAVAKAALGAGQKQVTHDIKNSSAYRKAEQGLKDLECTFKKSPVGIWVDENKGILYVIAAGVALGSATAMYVTRAGDLPAEWAAKLAKEKLRFKPIGEVELGVDDLKFKPSERQVELKTFATLKWKKVETKVTLRGSFKDDKFQAAGGGAKVVIPVGDAAKVTAHGNAAAVRGASGNIGLDYDLGLSVDVNPVRGLTLQLMAVGAQKDGTRSVGGGGGLQYKTNVGPVPMSLKGNANIKHVAPPAGPARTDYSVQFGLSLEF